MQFIYYYQRLLSKAMDIFRGSGVRQPLGHSRVKSLVQGPNSKMPLRTLRFEPTTFRSQAQCPNLQISPTHHNLQCGIAFFCSAPSGHFRECFYRKAHLDMVHPISKGPRSGVRGKPSCRAGGGGGLFQGRLRSGCEAGGLPTVEACKVPTETSVAEFAHLPLSISSAPLNWQVRTR